MSVLVLEFDADVALRGIAEAFFFEVVFGEVFLAELGFHVLSYE